MTGYFLIIWSAVFPIPPLFPALPGGTPRAEPRPWRARCRRCWGRCCWGCCCWGCCPALLRASVSAAGVRARRAAKRGGTEPGRPGACGGRSGHGAGEAHFYPRDPSCPHPEVPGGKSLARAVFGVLVALWTPNRAVTGAASVSPTAPISP